ncbi:hypothetical protein I1E95_16085 [Synechococcus sp. CBW1107]|uniref:hypothetical protein n=1 Tax=Synechococcus sp. CBW1107 TaxID=2789857 RepID=UPI0018CD9318|nr:hypothetical protein [Synechococcus sp. CBW1107]QPN56549.1 hypothetical protein I1E95_16085 [Synechococcus sp. CBW1107]
MSRFIKLRLGKETLYLRPEGPNRYLAYRGLNGTAVIADGRLLLALASKIEAEQDPSSEVIYWPYAQERLRALGLKM